MTTPTTTPTRQTNILEKSLTAKGDVLCMEKQGDKTAEKCFWASVAESDNKRTDGIYTFHSDHPCRKECDGYQTSCRKYITREMIERRQWSAGE